MKNIFRYSNKAGFILAILTFILNFNSLKAQWIQTSGPTGGIVNCLAASGTKLFAGTNGNGVYISTNNGTNWTPANSGIENSGVLDLAFSGQSLFAGTYDGLFKSTNDGSNWTEVNIGLLSDYVTNIAVSGSKIYAGSVYSIYFSSDYGTSWINLNTITGTWALDISDTSLFASFNSGKGVYRSTNDGVSWVPVNNGLTNIVLTFCFNGSNIYAGTYSGGVFLSSDNGANWIMKSNGLPNSPVNALISHGSNLFAGTENGVFLSTNNGSIWNPANDGLTNSHIFSFSIINTNIFAATSVNVWKRPLSEMTKISTISIKTVIQGFYNPFANRMNISDTVRAYLRNVSSPYNIVDSSIANIDSVTYTGNFVFSNALSGTYYIVLKHRNSIETWSKSGGEIFNTGTSSSFDFTSDSTQTYGNNVIRVSNTPALYAIYNGDVNQDMIIDASDVSKVENDVYNGVTGYVNTDLDGDGFVDANDLNRVENNTVNLIVTVKP
jgi:ligand-binding sensor domain-containing protein